jgi:hypothetical protein
VPGRHATAILLAALALAACSSEPAEVTEADYLADLQAVCTQTTADLDALPDPPEQISVTDFASEAARLLDAEAEQVRRLGPPSSLADDHRAFIRNTDEQSAAWTTIAVGATDDLSDATTQVAQLVLGRNDLADEMGASACRRGAG